MSLKTIVSSSIFLLFSIKASAQIVNIEDKRFRLQDSTDFEGKMTLAWNLNKNTNAIWSGNSDVLLAKNYLKSYFLAYGFLNVLRTGDKNLLNDRLGHFRYNRDLNRYLVAEAFVQGQFSEQLQIRYRYLFGSGLRLKLYPLIKKRIYLGTALVQEEMGFRQNEIQTSRLRLSTYISFQVPLYEGAKIISTSYVQPTIADFSVRRINSQTKLVLPIKGAFSFKTSFSLLSDNDSFIDAKVPNLTYQWMNGVVWDIGK